MLARLRRLVPPPVDLDARYAASPARCRDSAPAVFAAWLAENGELSAKDLRAYLLDADLHFSTTVAPAGEASRLALLGRGAMGEVFLARDRRLNRIVAIKQMDEKVAQDPDLARRFYTEAQITAQLDHPAIVPVFGLEQREDGSIAYAMRVIRGRTLREFLNETRGFYDQKRRPDAAHQLQARLLLFEDLCKALHYAHVRGVVHRDLKPDNVMVGPYGETLVMDWGVAKILGESERPLPKGATLTPVEGTGTGETLGTAKYMSPEQAAGENETLDARSDQYALGLILFELVALKPGNPGPNSAACWLNAASGRVAPLVHYAGEAIPHDLGAIIAKATRPTPAGRYPDVGVLAEDVRRFLRDEELIARRDGLGQRLGRMVSRHRRAAVAGLVGLSGVVVAVVLGATALGATGLAVSAWRTSQREQALSAVFSRVGDQAHRIDNALSGYAGEVRGLRSAATYALTHPPTEERPVYFSEGFKGPAEGRPPDIVDSAVYEAPASLGFPDNVAAPGVDTAALAGRLQQLQALQPEMRAMLGRATGAPPAEQAAMLLDHGIPMIWTYVAIEEGVLTGMPGVGEYPPDYDPRKRAWYQGAIASEGVVWDASDDESGQGLLLTAAAAVRDAAGAPLGVAALDIGVGHVTRELLRPADLTVPVRATLVDGSGRVVVDTDDPDAAREPGVSPWASLISTRPAGGWSETGDVLVVWAPVAQVGWTYVISGDSGELLGAW
jgi:tRNA A-37 threonylcarbamoyl transferase component Bud32